MKKNILHLNRRNFISRCSALALGSSSALATLTQLQLAHAQVAPDDDYKALVCVFLYGGNDAFNMLVPRSTAAYNDYANTRQSLALQQDELLPINSNQQNGVDYGLHPALSDVADLYTQEKVAVLANVGALVEPTSKTAYQEKSILLPPQLFSHNDQQNFIQSLQSSTRRNGWAGRAADIMGSMNSNSNLSMNISLSGSNLWQSGESVIPYSVNPNGFESINNLDRSLTPENSQNTWEMNRVATYEAILAQQQNHVLARSYAQSMKKSWDLSDEVGAAIASIPEMQTFFPAGNRMADSLRMAANMIAARNTLGVTRQTFFIGVGDFDTHGDQSRRHDILMEQLNDALTAFYQATQELGVANKVTTFTASDFGRTLTSNGDGTDHGWGSHHLIMGDAVAGGDIYGTMPELTIGSNDDMGEGRIIPTTSIDQYGATLASWFGLPLNSYADVFPNLKNFNSADAGFMKAIV